MRFASAELGVSRREDAAGEMAKPFEAPVTVGRKTERATAADCASARDLQSQGYRALYPRDIAALGVMTARCLGLEALKAAQPARLNYMPESPFSASLVELLPAVLAPATTQEQQQAIERAARDGQPLRKVEVTVGLEAAREDEIHIAGEGWQETLMLLGRADFDGDGKQDWLVRADLAMQHGTHRVSRLFLLTRDSPDSLIRAVRELKP